MILAMEIIVGNSSYPREEIEANSHQFRPLGLGYANLGALLMDRGLPYDSDTGRDYAAAITALMCGQAYLTSAEIASQIGPFEGYAENREPMLEVIRKHRAAVNGINANRVPEELLEEAEDRLARRLRPGPRLRLPQRPGHRAGAHRHHRLHDGLRHHRRRARHRPGEVQEAGRRRHDEDRQQLGARRPGAPGLQRGADRRPSSSTSTRTRPSRARPT